VASVRDGIASVGDGVASVGDEWLVYEMSG
jgi:hypothetical protein